MRRFKKSMAIVLAALLTVGTLAACAQTPPASSSTGSPTESGVTPSSTPSESSAPLTPLEISIAWWNFSDATTDEEMKADPMFQSVCKKFNITIKPVPLTWDDYTQKIQVWATSGTLPDIFSIDAVGTQYYYDWVKQGVVKLLPKDLGKYPNLKAYLDAPDINAYMVDGQYTMLPRKTYSDMHYDVVQRAIIYRWDWAQAAGITEEPDTFDDFTNMLKAVIQKDPAGTHPVGLTFTSKGNIGGFFWTYSNPHAAWNDWIKEDGKFVPAFFADSKVLPSLENMKKMYDAGVIDKDLPNLKGDMAKDKFTSNKAIAIQQANGPEIVTTGYKIAWSKMNPGKKITDCVKMLKPLKNPVDGNRYIAVFGTFWSESYISASVSDEKLERILQLYDWLVSEKGMDAKRFGMEGVDFKKSGSDYTILDDSYISGGEVQKYPAWSQTFPGLVTWDSEWTYDPANTSNNFGAEDEDKEWKKSSLEWLDWCRENTVIPEYYPQITAMSTPLKDKFVYKEYEELLKVMLSKDPVDKAWNAIVQGYKAKGLDKMIEEVNAEAQKQGIN